MTKSIISAALTAAVISFLVVTLLGDINRAAPTTVTDSSVFDRVMERKSIRIGYVLVSPTFLVDPNDGTKSGIFVEVLQKVASNLDLELEWAAEVGWQTMIEGLPHRSDKYDMVGSSVWANANRARVADFSVPIFYSAVGAFVKEDSSIDQVAEINRNEIRISAIDGEISATLAKEMFPLARVVSLPQNSTLSEMLLQVAAGNADVVFAEPSIVHAFLENNPGTLKNIARERPVHVYPTSFLMPQGNDKFRRMIDTAILELHNTGYVDSILAKYEPTPGAFFYRPSLPYRDGN